MRFRSVRSEEDSAMARLASQLREVSALGTV